MNDKELIEKLDQESKGLLYLSESEYPFEPIYWQGVKHINSSLLLELTNHSPNNRVEEREVEEFFAHATEEKPWYEEKERAECQRYQSLIKLLKTHLSDLRVYRIGEVEIKAYILGKTKSGSIAGLSTMIIET